LVPDLGVNVSFLEVAKPGAQQAPPRGVLVPAAAIVARDGKDVAFAVADGGQRAQLREIEVGRAMGDDRQVTSGLSAGDTVVLDPPSELQDGGRIVQARQE
jgi:multidrug efflux pump subunit AcrA (membrane-fusion protein)